MWQTPITPRVSETDGAGHINNTVVPVWLEAGRREVFRILTPDLSFATWRVALVNMNVDYLAQTYFQQEAMVKTWVGRVGTKSFTLYEELWQGDRLCARGAATYVYFNYEKGSSEPIPVEARRALQAHLKE
ncbi:MAG: thioesterase [Rhodospirillales bacterium CG15_BIG_FIL_POST_REV_8_21_14_020_66_15]|nr:MAG: thioesterase [Rhodospirillales bacterium CG15_BIG_FIL_POST_REV_8_21_14_020_66_15]